MYVRNHLKFFETTVVLGNRALIKAYIPIFYKGITLIAIYPFVRFGK